MMKNTDRYPQTTQQECVRHLCWYQYHNFMQASKTDSWTAYTQK